jgi:hypothetical protein
MRLHLQFFLRFGRTPICVTRAETNFGTSAEENWGGGEGMPQPRSQGLSFCPLGHSRTQSPSYARCDEGASQIHNRIP